MRGQAEEAPSPCASGALAKAHTQSLRVCDGWETLPGHWQWLQPAGPAGWWEDWSFLSGFLSIGAKALSLPHPTLAALPCTPAEEQGPSWRAGTGSSRTHQGQEHPGGAAGPGLRPCTLLASTMAPRRPACALTQLHCCSRPGVRGLVLGAKGVLDPVPLGSGLRHWEGGNPCSSCGPTGSQKPGTSEKLPAPPEQQAGGQGGRWAVSGAGWELRSAPAQEMSHCHI